MTLTTLLERINPFAENAAPEIAAPETPTKPLAAALAKLEIEPFSPESVEKYKRAQLIDSWVKYKHELFEKGWRECSLILYGRYVNETRAFFGPEWTDADYYHYAARPLEQPTVANPAGIEYPRCFAMGWHRVEVFAAGGRMVMITKGTPAVPEHVVRKAEQIQSAIPGVTFEADVLETDDRRWDPFLIVRYGEEEYYIEVWDEQDFERFAVK